MNTKNKQHKSRRLPIILSVIGLVLIAGVIAGFLFQDKLKTAVADVQTNIENNGKPQFVFAAAQFPDWATSGNVYANLNDTTGDGGEGKTDVPISGINISQCKAGSNCSMLVQKCDPHDKNNTYCRQLDEDTTDTHCSVSAYYKEQTIDPSVAVADELKQWSKFGTTPTEVGTKTLAMVTPDGSKSYQFYQYDTNNKDATYKRGSAFGFIPLSNGHIEVRGVCWEARQLDEVLPTLNAVSLKK